MQKKSVIDLLEMVLEDVVLQDMVMTRRDAEDLLRVVKKNSRPATLESEGFERLIKRMLTYYDVDINTHRSLNNLMRKLAKNKLELKKLVGQRRSNFKKLEINEETT